MSGRRLHLNAFLMGSGHHEAAWRLPESDPNADLNVEHWIALARLAERGKLDSLFLADAPTIWHAPEFRPSAALEPTVLLTALAAATTHIGLIATASTTYNSPYNLARRFASLDHVSGGRAGWNVVTTADRSAAANFGLAERPAHADRYARADEFLEVSYKLWDSWDDDAVVADKASGRYARADGIRPIAHEGPHFRVHGPLNVPRSPQGRPLIVQAGSSPTGRDFAARHAEAVFTAQQTLADAQAFYADLKARAVAAGRDPAGVKILPGIAPVLGGTEAEARARARELEELLVSDYGLAQLSEILEVDADRFDLDAPLPADLPDPHGLEGMRSRSALVLDLARRDRLTVRQLLARLAGGRGHWTVVGTPEQVAAVIEEWFLDGAADGFNVMGQALPSGLEDFVDHVVPLLQRRGLFRTEYEGGTLREHYDLPRPASHFAAAAAAALA